MWRHIPPGMGHCHISRQAVQFVGGHQGEATQGPGVVRAGLLVQMPQQEVGPRAGAGQGAPCPPAGGDCKHNKRARRDISEPAKGRAGARAEARPTHEAERRRTAERHGMAQYASSPSIPSSPNLAWPKPSPLLVALITRKLRWDGASLTPQIKLDVLSHTLRFTRSLTVCQQPLLPLPTGPHAQKGQPPTSPLQQR